MQWQNQEKKADPAFSFQFLAGKTVSYEACMCGSQQEALGNKNKLLFLPFWKHHFEGPTIHYDYSENGSCFQAAAMRSGDKKQLALIPNATELPGGGLC